MIGARGWLMALGIREPEAQIAKALDARRGQERVFLAVEAARQLAGAGKSGIDRAWLSGHPAIAMTGAIGLE